MITASVTTDGTGVVMLEGQVGIAEATQLKQTLVEALAEPGDLRVEVQQASGVDVTAVQLLWAAQRQVRQMGRSFEIAGPWNQETETHLKEMGLDPAQLFAAGAEKGSVRDGGE